MSEYIEMPKFRKLSIKVLQVRSLFDGLDNINGMGSTLQDSNLNSTGYDLDRLERRVAELEKRQKRRKGR